MASENKTPPRLSLHDVSYDGVRAGGRTGVRWAGVGVEMLATVVVGVRHLGLDPLDRLANAGPDRERGPPNQRWSKVVAVEVVEVVAVTCF